MNTEQPAALAPGIAPPQRIDLGDLLLRRWQPDDLLPRFEAIVASFDHLHPWMDWLAEPMTLERQRDFGKAVATSWPSPDGSCHYGIFDAEGTVLGAIGLHDRVGPRALEIGYWCHVAHTGRGVITRAADALTRIALELPGIDHVEIHCDEANIRSAAVPRRLGYRLDRVEPREVRAPAESGRDMFWIKDRQSREV
ncbi:GNAT family N-acetyltransferase [Nocardia shimofusensis]|uniref:GNAT family N-acetyltransferase n=1 Tax=Nocardia shimofusensis TaxID=228596 RepID=UPI000A00647C|nr:GNAT family N-acetyltransferase [Nocardia shimofusensis]